MLEETLLDYILTRKRGLAVLIWTTIIFIGSSIPGDEIPGQMPPDYLMHFAEYFILGALVSWWSIFDLFPKKPLASILFSSVFASGYGIFDELHQYFVPGRTLDPRDWVADTAGGITGAIIVIIILFWAKRLK